MTTSPMPDSVPPPDRELGVARGKLSPPQCEFVPVLPRAAEVLLRTAVLAKFVAACAPAGYGKTVILAHLFHVLAQRGQRCLWITLDDRDHSVGSLTFLLGAALHGGGDGAGSLLRDAGQWAGNPRAEPDRLLQAVAELPGATTLFIDNLHFCTDPLLPALLERLVFGSGPRLRLVLSSVTAPPIDITRAKLELGAVELGPAQLCLDAPGIASLIERAGLPRPDNAALGKIVERTEGWPAAVRLLQVLMVQSAGTPAEATLLDTFSGEDHDIARMLTRRVLAGFEPRVVQFLTEIALVREFSAELALEMTGQAQAREWVEDLLRRNVLVFPLDSSRDWLRMHTLLRQHLLAEGRKRLPRERRRALLDSAARWHAERGDLQSALEAALAAPAMPLASHLLDRLARRVAGNQGRLAEYIRWVEQLVSAGIVLSLEAHAWYVWSLCFTLRYEQAHAALEALDHRLAEAPQLEREAGDMMARLSLLRVVVGVYLDALDLVHAEAQNYLARPRTLDALAVATVTTGAALSRLGLGDAVQARRYMQQAAGAVARSESGYGHAWVAAVLACIELLEGEPMQADRLLAKARPGVAASLVEDALVVASLDFVHARALLDMGRVEGARDRALRGLRRAGLHGVGETAVHGLSACVSLWNGEDDGPFSLDALQDVARRYPARVQQHLAIGQVRRLLRLDRTDQALAMVGRLPQALGPEGAMLHAAGLLLEVELLVARGKAREAIAHAERHLKYFHGLSFVREQIELCLVVADVHVRADETRLAQRALTRALLLAARRRLVRPLYEHLATVERVIGVVRTKEFGFTQPEELALLQDLHDACRAGASPGATAPAAPASPAPSADVGPLTSRELQLLEMLSLGLSNQHIADRLNLSVPTVKWHLYNLYAKLAVKSRVAAMARGRALNLLPR